MRIPVDNGKTIDTDVDLTPAERHILQKLFGWKTMVDSLSQFKEKTQRTLQQGWNNSGPILPSHALKMVIQQLENEVTERIKQT